MGLFRDAGKRLERFKRTVEDVAKDEAEYECEECGELVYADRDDCPECGSPAVVARTSEPDGETASGGSEGVEGGDEQSVEGADAPRGDEPGTSGRNDGDARPD